MTKPKYADREEMDVATPAELICESPRRVVALRRLLRNLWTILFARARAGPLRARASLWLFGGDPEDPIAVCDHPRPGRASFLLLG